MSPGLFDIGAYFAHLSLLAIGGVSAVIVDMHRYLVEANGWISETDFVNMIALGQAAPGPNVLMVSLLGWKLAGLGGAIVAIVGMCLPSSLLAYAFARFWSSSQADGWRALLQRGLAPVAIGLVFAAGYVLTRSADHGILAYGITLATVFINLYARVNPLWYLGAAAVSGAIFAI